MAERFLVDTDVLIDYLRNLPQAVKFIENMDDRPSFSTITVAELYAGVRDGQERIRLEAFIQKSVLIDIDELICTQAGLLLRQYRKSHGLGLADALIAASVQSQSAGLASLNARHFPMLPNVLVPYSKP